MLIVSPHFPPTNAPDHQRIRVALPYLQELGWEAQILAVRPDEVPHPQDPDLERAIPEGLPITRTGALPSRWTRQLGLGGVGWRCWLDFKRAGDRLLATQPFDLVFFSTTIFPVMTLGPIWQKQFGVPYVLDFQDPWLTDYQHRPQVSPPGGRFKYGMIQALARISEPYAVRSANHILSVSPTYPQTLQQRYPQLREEQFTVLPFGAPEQDFARLPELGIRQSIFDPKDGKRHWVYVGRGGADLAIALRALFAAIHQERDRAPHLWQAVHLHFVGTSYAPPPLAVKTIAPISAEYGLADMVSEHPYRIPYFEAQQLLVESDAILMLGSDNPSYTASKLYPGILARKPILAIFHGQSSVVEILQRCEAGTVIPFTPEENLERVVQRVIPSLKSLLQQTESHYPETNWEAFRPYSGYEMTRRLCGMFDRVVEG
ncbi:hypothetical protein BST81_08360 [Leptolyngbya sp. 'hensonii']|nr:hypothetical protein BST81_08360 [Leptolyngbya sp. 'hensonii']